MADKKITQLTAATTPFAGTEVLPIVQGGATTQVSVANLTAGRDVTALNATVSDTFLVGKTSASRSVVGIWGAGSTGVLTATSTDPSGVFYSKTALVGAGVMLTYSDVGGAETLVGAAFANGTFGAVSDVNKKKNIQDARSYIDDVMKLRVVKYNWITDNENAPKDLGWIAQEVQEVFPGIVSEIEGSLLLKKEVFLPMLMKCVQEQQVLIEDLTARLAALEAA